MKSDVSPARSGCKFRSLKAGIWLAVLGLSGHALSQESGKEQAAGKAEEFRYSHRDIPIRVLTHRPAGFSKGPLLVLFHGATRDADSYHRSGRILAERMGMMLAVPEFDRKRFDPEAYQEGGVMKSGKPVGKEEWTFGYVRPLIEAVSRTEGGKPAGVYLVGHSAGAQFVNRMAAMAPEPVDRIVVVNAGALVFPTRDLPYPYGFGGLPEALSDDEALKRYLAVPMTLYIGTADTGEKTLPTAGPAMKQGADRVERSRRCYEMGRKLAEERGWRFAWDLVEAEGLDHRSPPMWEHPLVSRAMLGEEAAD